MFSPVCPQSPTGVSLSKYLSHYPIPPSPYGQQRGTLGRQLPQAWKFLYVHPLPMLLLSCFSHVWLYGPQATKLFCPLASPGKNTGVGCHAPLQGSSRRRDWAQASSVSCIGGQARYYQCRLGSPPRPHTCFTAARILRRSFPPAPLGS